LETFLGPKNWHEKSLNYLQLLHYDAYPYILPAKIYPNFMSASLCINFAYFYYCLILKDNHLINSVLKQIVFNRNYNFFISRKYCRDRIVQIYLESTLKRLNFSGKIFGIFYCKYF